MANSYQAPAGLHDSMIEWVGRLEIHDVYQFQICPPSTSFCKLSPPIKKILHRVFMAVWKLLSSGLNHGSILTSLRAISDNGAMIIELNDSLENLDITHESSFHLVKKDVHDICSLVKYILSVHALNVHLPEVSIFYEMCGDVQQLKFSSYHALRNFCFFIYNNVMLYSETDIYYLFMKARLWKLTCSKEFQKFWDSIKGNLPAGDDWIDDIPAAYYPYHLDVAESVLGSQMADRGNAHLIINLYGNCRKHVHGDVLNRKSSSSLEASCRPILKCYPWFAAYFFKFLAVKYYNRPRTLTKPGDLYEYFLNPPIPLERWSN